MDMVILSMQQDHALIYKQRNECLSRYNEWESRQAPAAMDAQTRISAVAFLYDMLPDSVRRVPFDPGRRSILTLQRRLLLLSPLLD